MIKLAWFSGLTIVFMLLLFFFCTNHVGVNSVGIGYNSWTGEVHVQKQNSGSYSGWYLTSPFVRVAVLNTVPMVVQIPSRANIVTQKLVRFNPDGAIDFVREQGFSWDLAMSQNNILMGYAFSGKKYPFLDEMENKGIK